MKCQEFESIVNDLAREQILEATMREQAVLHSATCESCSETLLEQQNLTKALRELSSSPQETSPAGIEAKLVAEFRRYQATKIVPAASAHPQTLSVAVDRNRRRYWAYAAVAATVIVVALGVAAFRRNGPNAPVPVAKAGDPVHSGGVTPSDLSVKQQQQQQTIAPVSHSLFRQPVKQKPARVRTPRNTVTVRSLDILAANYTEVTTDFIPIGYSSNVQEGGHVVRLELSRYAMARFGIPVNVDRYDEKVKADVWVGTDGLAHAIRFVQ